MKRVFVFFILAILINMGFISAANYYVSTAGSDTNLGTDTQPFRTIQKCANVVQAGDTCLVLEGNYAEHVSTKAGGISENSRIIFKAEGIVTMQGFDIRHPYVTIEGFDITGYQSIYDGHIVIYTGGNFCSILNNTIHDGAIGVTGIYFYLSGQGASNCIIRGNLLSNMDYVFLTVFGSNHLFERNTFQNQNSQDYIRLFGNGHVFRHNIFNKGSIKSGSGNHPDFVQTFGGQGLESYNHLFEENWVENLESQFGQLNSGDGVTSKGILHGNVHSIVFRRNIFVNLSYNANVGMPGVQFQDNTFYLFAYQLGGIYYSGSLTRGDASDGLIKNNVFLAGGGRANSSNGVDGAGFYSMGGAGISKEVIQVFITLEPLGSQALIATGILNDLQLGYLNSSGYVTHKFAALSTPSEIILPDAYVSYRDQIYQTLSDARTAGASLNVNSFSFLPITLSRDALLTDLKRGYIDSNGYSLLKTKELTDLSQFKLDIAYATHKAAVYNNLTASIELDKSISDSFTVDYNYVAGAQSAGFPSKRNISCIPNINYLAYNFCEPHGINGGNPMLQDINNPIGPDGLPFTSDDGLIPLPGSPLCGNGEGGSDIGAYECASGTAGNRAGDINNDGSVNVLDIILIVNDYGKSSGFEPRADMIKDNFIDLKDIVELTRYWGRSY